jgi:hypothetical protein
VPSEASFTIAKFKATTLALHQAKVDKNTYTHISLENKLSYLFRRNS